MKQSEAVITTKSSTQTFLNKAYKDLQTRLFYDSVPHVLFVHSGTVLENDMFSLAL